MKQKILAAGLCAALLAGNYAAMQGSETMILRKQAVLEIDEAAAVLTEHEENGGETVQYQPGFLAGERAVFEGIAEQEEAQRRDFSISNRPLRESESERMAGLLRGYTRALRLPERPLPLEKTDGAAWYDAETLAYQYPPEEMDDEMLLELIEFRAKLNVVYAERRKETAPAALDTELTEEQAVEAAKQAVWQFYAIDPAPYDVYAMFLDDEGQRLWDVSFFPPNDDLLSDTGKYYQVLGVELDAATGEPVWLDRTENRRHDDPGDLAGMSEEQRSACRDVAARLLQGLISPTDELTVKGVFSSEKYPDIVYVLFAGGVGGCWRVGLVWPTLSASGLQQFASLQEAKEGLTAIG